MGYQQYEASLMLRCTGCKRQYDLVKLKRIVERKNDKEIKCPYCGKKIGELS
jgi:DNA-directed RNA polymerase subunit RPC12/RpoP